MTLSDATTKGWVAKAGATLAGTAGNDALRTGGASTLAGGAGDDTYYVYTSKDIVVEKANQGVDTIYSTAPAYRLPDNVENLVINSVNATGVGNSGDNIIIGAGTGAQTLNGGAGNDVLVAGVGKDTFVVAKGQGSDVIVGFKAGTDVVQLNDYTSLTTFAKVKAAMTQVGADTVVNLGDGEKLTLRDHKISDFNAESFRLPVDKSQFALTFSDEFNSFSWSASGVGGTWQTRYPSGRSLPTNKEAEYYSDSTVGVNPFSIHDGVLDITAARATPGVDTPAGSGLTWTSGIITTYKSFSQLYGYFEVKAQLPAGQGLWPAFWLLPADNTWPPELDVFETLGHDPTTLYASTHSMETGKKGGASAAVTVSDTSTAFHTYAVNWQADYITWYMDGSAIAKAATPADMHKPMYMLLNLAVGGAGSWPGATNASTPSEAHMLIDYVRAYTDKPPALDVAADSGAPSLGLGTVVGGNGAAVGATVAGTAKAGALVEIYNGKTLVGTTTADAATGTYDATLANLGAGTHKLTTQVAGSPSSTSVTVVVGTAADIMKQMTTLPKITDLGGIVLTDTNVLTVGSVSEMKKLMNNAKSVLAEINGGYTFAVTTTSGNTTTVTNYDSSGVFASSTAETSSGGQLTARVVRSADGASDSFTYKNGMVVNETHVYADGTKEVFLSNITGKSYVAEHDLYNASGSLVSVERTRADGSHDYVLKYDSQSGTKTTDTYTSTGDLSIRTIQKASGDLIQQKYTGSFLASEYITFGANSKYATELKTYDQNVLVQDTIRNADGTRDTFSFNITGQNFTTKHQAYDAAGKVEYTDLTLKDGSHAVTASQAQQTFVSTKDVADVFKGMGGDTFVFDKPSGRDIIQGFKAGSGANHDVIKIDAHIVADLAHLSIATVGADTIITLGSPHDTITLKGIAAAALTHDNFLLI